MTLSERDARQLYKLLGKLRDALDRDNEEAQRDILRVVQIWVDQYAANVLRIDLTEKKP